jgi:hypothetical protein
LENIILDILPTMTSNTFDNIPFAGDFKGDGVCGILWSAQGQSTNRIWAGCTSRQLTDVNESA